MKRNIIYIGTFMILLIILIIVSVTFINNNNIITIQDGLKLALTLDENPISSFPNYNEGEYTVNISCNDGVKGYFLPLKGSSTKEYKISVDGENKNIKCSINFKTKTNNELLKTKVETEGISGIGSIVYEEADNAGYRYEGQNPNNYVWYNDELWRIIGSIPVCMTANCGNSSTRLVKIIRNESIGNLSFDAKDSDYTGLWGSNTLYKLLNTYYYGVSNRVKDATNNSYCYSYPSTTKSKCDYSVIGIDSDKYYGGMIERVYWNTNEVSSGIIPSVAYEKEKGKQSVYNYIGLITFSDYGYATSASHSTSVYDYNKDENYTLGNWLCIQDMFTVNNHLSSKNNVLYVNSSGRILSREPYYASGVRPVVYLKDSVYVVMGDGTITNPYILAY